MKSNINRPATYRIDGEDIQKIESALADAGYNATVVKTQAPTYLTSADAPAASVELHLEPAPQGFEEPTDRDSDDESWYDRLVNHIFNQRRDDTPPEAEAKLRNIND